MNIQKQILTSFALILLPALLLLFFILMQFLSVDKHRTVIEKFTDSDKVLTELSLSIGDWKSISDLVVKAGLLSRQEDAEFKSRSLSEKVKKAKESSHFPNSELFFRDIENKISEIQYTIDSTPQTGKEGFSPNANTVASYESDFNFLHNLIRGRSVKNKLARTQLLEEDHNNYLFSVRISIFFSIMYLIFAAFLLFKTVKGIVVPIDQLKKFVSSYCSDGKETAIKIEKPQEIKELSEGISSLIFCLRELTAETKAIIDSASSSIFKVSSAGNILHWNRSSEELFEYTGEELSGKNIMELVPDIPSNWSLFLSKQRRANKETGYKGVKKSGETFVSDFTLGEIRSGDTIEYVIIMNDVSASEQLKQRLAQSEKLETIGHLAMGISHEVNTPLQYITTNNEFLTSSFSDLADFVEEAKKELLQIETASNSITDLEDKYDLPYLIEEIPNTLSQNRIGVKRISEIISSLKSFTDVDNNQTKIPIKVNELLSNFVMVIKNDWKYASEITTKFDSAVDRTVGIVGDIKQIILSMILNSAEAIAHAGIAPGKIHISTYIEDNSIAICVEDNGPGIREDVQEHIFDPFFSTKIDQNSVGQGLNFAYNSIVNTHKGSIECLSAAGSTKFVIKLKPSLSHLKQGIS